MSDTEAKPSDTQTEAPVAKTLSWDGFLDSAGGTFDVELRLPRTTIGKVEKVGNIELVTITQEFGENRTAHGPVMIEGDEAFKEAVMSALQKNDGAIIVQMNKRDTAHPFPWIALKA